MEVHSHSHTARKKWYHYFWEFFMLFLAVTLGFVVENLREQRVDRHREIQYVRSMREDIMKDTTMLNTCIQQANSVVINIDTILDIIQHEHFDPQNVYILYRANLRALGYFGPSFTDRTTMQLKNSGAMRLISDESVANAMVEYWGKANYVVGANDLLEGYKLRARDQSYRIFDQKYYNSAGIIPQGPDIPRLMTNDLTFLTEFANRLSHIRNLIFNVYLKLLKGQSVYRINLENSIKEKYGL